MYLVIVYMPVKDAPLVKALTVLAKSCCKTQVNYNMDETSTSWSSHPSGNVFVRLW